MILFIYGPHTQSIDPVNPGWIARSFGWVISKLVRLSPGPTNGRRD